MAGRNFENRTLFHGDNLDFLREMHSETIDLIATDPPFNKGRDFHATPDSLAKDASFQDRWSWKDDVQQEWIDQIEDDHPALKEAILAARRAHSDGMGAFLCFLAVRLIAMRRVLKPTGSIYLHCDPTASHYLKMVMDAIFGSDAFRNEIIWKRTGSHGGANRWGPIHDVILFYGMSKDSVWNKVYQPYEQSYLDGYYKFEDARGRYQLVSLTGAGTRSGESGKPWRGVDPTDTGQHWAVPMKSLRLAYPDRDFAGLSVQERLDLLEEAGLVQWPKRGKVPRQKRYLDEAPGVPVQDICTDISALGAQAGERTGYPTQKPLALYERIIEASSNEGDWVLDPFCGCATTLLAAEKLGRNWVGIDIWKKAKETVVQRLVKEGILLDPDGKSDDMFAAGQVSYSQTPPHRDADGVREPRVPYMAVPERFHEPGERLSRAQILEQLLRQYGPKCQGCDRVFDSPRYLQLDHNTPRSDGGLNHISNRVLLCGPCNNLKSNRFTLSGLRRENHRLGHMPTPH